MVEQHPLLPRLLAWAFTAMLAVLIPQFLLLLTSMTGIYEPRPGHRLVLSAAQVVATIGWCIPLIVLDLRVKQAMLDIGDRRACWTCGYDLTDRPAAVCPECGDGG